MSTIDGSINFLQGFANQALSRAAGLSGRIPTNYSANLTSPSFSHKVGSFTGDRPPRLSDMLASETDSTQASLRFLDGETEKWMAKYFPELNATLGQAPERWLAEILSGESPFGLSDQAFESVWHAGRDRAYRAASTETAQIKKLFAGSGFTLPPGAMVAAISAAEERASDAIAEVNRDQVNRAEEIKLDLLKFAEEQAIRLKLGILDSLASFYRQWVALPDKDIERLKTKAQMYSALQSALSSYHNVELGFEDLRLKAAEIKHGASIDTEKLKVGLIAAQPGGAAMANAVQAFANAAGSAVNAQSTFGAEILTGGIGS